MPPSAPFFPLFFNWHTSAIALSIMQELRLGDQVQRGANIRLTHKVVLRILPLPGSKFYADAWKDERDYPPKKWKRGVVSDEGP